MPRRQNLLKVVTTFILTTTFFASPAAISADKDLLDILLANGVITPTQHAELMQKESLTSDDIVPRDQRNATDEN